MASNSLEPVVEPPPGVKTEPDKGTSWHDSPSGSDKSTTPKEEDSFCVSFNFLLVIERDADSD